MGVGGASVIGETSGGSAGSRVDGTGGSPGGKGGTSGTGGAAMAGTGGNGNSSGGSAGGSGSSGGEGGAGGSGPEPIQCASTTVRGTLTDSTGSTNVTGYQGPATIISMSDTAVPYSLEFVLRAPDDAEWHYDVTLPCLHTGPTPVGLPPQLGVRVGDTVELESVGGTSFFPEDQAIVMLHEGELVLFTVDEPELEIPTPIDLSAYGFDVGVEPTAFGPPNDCVGAAGLPGTGVAQRLVVSKDSETVRVEASQTVLVGGFTFSVEQLSYVDGAGFCDPPGWSRYGGFRMQQ
jgi:hypothetical protein